MLLIHLMSISAICRDVAPASCHPDYYRDIHHLQFTFEGLLYKFKLKDIFHM